VILAPEPVWILLAYDYLGFVSRIRVQVAVPWLIKPLHREE